MAEEGGARPSEQQPQDGLRALVHGAAIQFSELTGKEPEQVSGLRETDGGWSVLLEVVDVSRVPDTTSVLSTYRVDLNRDGQLRGYERIRRYTRASTS